MPYTIVLDDEKPATIEISYDLETREVGISFEEWEYEVTLPLDAFMAMLRLADIPVELRQDE